MASELRRHRHLDLPDHPGAGPGGGGRLAAAAITLAMALVSSAAVLAVGLPWLRPGIEVAVADAGVATRVAGLAVAVALFAVLGVGLAALLRNQVAAVVVGLLWWSQGLGGSSPACCASPPWSAGCPWGPPRR